MTRFLDSAEPTGVRNDDRVTWLAERRKLLTASDVAAVLGEDEYRTPLDLYVEKLMGREDEPLSIDDPRFWGTKLEQPILRIVAEYYGWDYEPGGELLRSRVHPHIGATLDSEVDRRDGVGWVPLEGKTTRMPRGWNEEEGELPTRVLIQAQSQALVCRVPVVPVFALLQGSRPCLIDVHASIAFHAVIVEQTEEFMSRLPRLDPPPTTASDRDRRALERLFPEVGQTAVRLPAEAVEYTREIFELGAQIKRLESRRDELRNMLRASIGQATYGLLAEPVDGKACWRWQTQDRAEHVVRASSSRVLLALKNAPVLTGPAALPEPAPTLVDSLSASLRDPDVELVLNSPMGPGAAEAAECHEKMRIGKRRRARR